MDIEPQYGTLGQAEMLIKETHEHGMKLLVDIVPNHSSDKHVWFQEALRSAPGSAARNRYIFRDGQGPNGDLPPNNWQAVFGGPAWERIREADGHFGQWYLHLFAVGQPDFNWENAEVHTYFEEVLIFWLDRGVDGFRIDVAHGLVKAAGLPDIVAPDPKAEMLAPENRPFWDQDGVHDIYRQWRKILDAYAGDRMAVAEAWVSPASRIARYLRPDELANSFNFDFLSSPWESEMLKKMINRSMEALQEVGAPSSWVFNNHDVVRSVDRFDLDLIPGKANTTLERQGDSKKFNIVRGTRRARAGALLMLALPGGAYVYQGEELALPEAREIPEDRLTDPRWSMSQHTDRGRDGCRVPLPWRSNSAGAFGFSTNDALTPTQAWLPQSPNWGSFSVELQERDTDSTLNLYRRALALRKSEEVLGDGSMEWINTSTSVLAFTRSADFACYVNFGAPIELPKNSQVLISSAPLEGSMIPTDTAVWLRLIPQ
jgi:alpha-glucosidase